MNLSRPLMFLLLANTGATVSCTKTIRGGENLVGGDQDEHSSRQLNHLLESYGDVPTHHLGGSNLNIRNLASSKKNNNSNSQKDDKRKKTSSPLPPVTLAPVVSCNEPCDPAGVKLENYPQWQGEEGYWIGEYTFYKADGTPFVSANWNYPYGGYRGFITGNVQGNAYRQRNVFFYPPQTAEKCATTSNKVQGSGTCGIHGNTKIFSADQTATTCNTNPALGGDVAGPYAGIFDTTTELIGADNALLYQVFLAGTLFQSQLTTLTIDSSTNTTRRTRTAQGFFNGLPSSVSFYRERKVDKATFYSEMAKTIAEYNILESDTCTWKDNPAYNPPIIGTGLLGTAGCTTHLEESFAL